MSPRACAWPKYGIHLTPLEWRDILAKLTSQSAWPFDHPVVRQIADVVNDARAAEDFQE